MKVYVKNAVIMNSKMAAITFETDVKKNKYKMVSKTINLSLQNIIKITKAAKEHDFEKCEDKCTSDFALLRGMLLLKFDNGRNYFCVISDQAIRVLEETAMVLITKRKQLIVS